MQTLTVSYKSATPYIPWGLIAPKRNTVSCKLRGSPASCGIVEGPCTIIRNLADLNTLRNGTILVCEIPLPALAPYMSLLRGLVAEQGGPLSIASGHAREYEIPAVVGLNGVMDAIHTGDIIRIDGSKGTVEILG
jgi:pyruvate,water dikinase